MKEVPFVTTVESRASMTIPARTPEEAAGSLQVEPSNLDCGDFAVTGPPKIHSLTKSPDGEGYVADVSVHAVLKFKVPVEEGKNAQAAAEETEKKRKFGILREPRKLRTMPLSKYQEKEWWRMLRMQNDLDNTFGRLDEVLEGTQQGRSYYDLLRNPRRMRRFLRTRHGKAFLAALKAYTRNYQIRNADLIRLAPKGLEKTVAALDKKYGIQRNAPLSENQLRQGIKGKLALGRKRFRHGEVKYLLHLIATQLPRLKKERPDYPVTAEKLEHDPLGKKFLELLAKAGRIPRPSFRQIMLAVTLAAFLKEQAESQAFSMLLSEQQKAERDAEHAAMAEYLHPEPVQQEAYIRTPEPAPVQAASEALSQEAQEKEEQAKAREVEAEKREQEAGSREERARQEQAAAQELLQREENARMATQSGQEPEPTMDRIQNNPRLQRQFARESRVPSERILGADPNLAIGEFLRQEYTRMNILKSDEAEATKEGQSILKDARGMEKDDSLHFRDMLDEKGIDLLVQDTLKPRSMSEETHELAGNIKDVLFDNPKKTDLSKGVSSPLMEGFSRLSVLGMDEGRQKDALGSFPGSDKIEKFASFTKSLGTETLLPKGFREKFQVKTMTTTLTRTSWGENS